MSLPSFTNLITTELCEGQAGFRSYKPDPLQFTNDADIINIYYYLYRHSDLYNKFDCLFIDMIKLIFYRENKTRLATMDLDLGSETLYLFKLLTGILSPKIYFIRFKDHISFFVIDFDLSLSNYSITN